MLSDYAGLLGLLDRISGKWGFYILLLLFLYGTLNFNSIKKNSKFISSRTLSKRLKDFVELGLVAKRTVEEFPLSVEYTLTEEGKKFVGPIINFFNVNAGRS